MLRIATLNFLMDTKRLRERIDLLVDTLEFEDLDFLCLQEVPGPERAGFYVGDVLSYKLGMDYKVIGQMKGAQNSYGNVTISRHPVKTYENHVDKRGSREHTQKDGQAPLLATITVVDGRPVYVLNVHFPWGAAAEADRLSAASRVSAIAERAVTRDSDPLVFLVGDLNCAPDSRTVRYLRGLDIDAQSGSTLWLDAWSEAGDHSQSGHTSGDPTYFAQATAQSVRPLARPEQMPKRRIDYAMSYGWTWGGPGQPVAARTFGTETFLDPELGELTVSDHKGLIADFWTPEPIEA